VYANYRGKILYVSPTYYSQELITGDLGVPWILYKKEDGTIDVSIYLELLKKVFCRKGYLIFPLDQQIVSELSFQLNV